MEKIAWIDSEYLLRKGIDAPHRAEIRGRANTNFLIFNENTKGFVRDGILYARIVFLDYDASLSNEKKQEQYAQKWYEKNIDNENAFVYFYFGTDHE